jgi:carboxyl-terminal processing protease
LLVAPLGHAAPTNELNLKADNAYKAGKWVEACRLYEASLQQNRQQPACREGIARCMRRIHQDRRFADPGYVQAIGKLNFSQALDVYEQVLNVVSLAYVDPGKADLNLLWKRGVEEVEFALASAAFRQRFLNGPRADLLERCRKRLLEYKAVKIAGRDDALDQSLALAREQVKALLSALQDEGLEVKPKTSVAFTLEFAAGACNALDEYSFFLAPGFFNDLQAALRGRTATIGVELATVDGGLQISRVYKPSPAYERSLQPGVRLVRIDGKPVANLSPEAALDRLRGENGSTVEIEVRYPDPNRTDTDTIKLVRRPVAVTSVEWEVMPTPASDYIGYIRVFHFQETTAQELKEALADLQGQGIRGLILDLRGNPGGSFKAAVQAAELFLTEGLIVQTKAPRHIKDYNRPYEVKGGNPLLASAIPIRVLVDGETASAAEALAGALKERGRAILFGQPTYGKFTIQCMVTLNKAPLKKLPAGIRITVARFSPKGNFSEAGQGITPNVVVPAETALTAAFDDLRAPQGSSAMPAPMPGMTMPSA